MTLCEPMTLKKQTLKNRLVMAPMTTYSGNSDLTPSKAEIDYMRLRTEDVAIAISPAISINEQAQAFENQITLKADRFIEPMKPFVTAMKGHGAKAIAQLHHGGRMNVPHLYENHDDIVSASAVKAPREGFVTPRPMTIKEIEQTVKDFALATKRAIEAGFDGIELHGANTYLLQQFFSPHTNKRSDAYGGSLKKRLRFIQEVVEATNDVIKQYAKDDFIFGYRFSPEELESDGITLNDTVYLLEYLKATNLDYIHVSMGHYAQSSIRHDQDQTPTVKTLLDTLDKQKPLIGSGGLRNLEDVKQAEALGYELMAIGLPLIADPKAVVKICHGEPTAKQMLKTTMPEPLYNRLYKFRERFEARGITFK